MKYKGIEIGEPTLKMFDEYVSRQNFGFPAKAAFDHFKAKHWCTSKGKPLQSLEAAVNAYNGVYLNRIRQDNLYCQPLF